LSWQITPRVLLEATTDSDRAATKRAFEAMMKMDRHRHDRSTTTRTGAPLERTLVCSQQRERLVVCQSGGLPR